MYWKAAFCTTEGDKYHSEQLNKMLQGKGTAGIRHGDNIGLTTNITRLCVAQVF